MTLEEAWDAVIEALPPANVDDVLDGWIVSVHRYPRTSVFPQVEADAEGTQWVIQAMPAVDSHHRNALSVQSRTQVEGLLELSPMLKDVIREKYSWKLPDKPRRTIYR